MADRRTHPDPQRRWSLSMKGDPLRLATGLAAVTRSLDPLTAAEREEVLRAACIMFDVEWKRMEPREGESFGR